MENFGLIKSVYDLLFFLAFGVLAWIFLYEIFSQLRDAWRNWRMSDEERAEIEMWSRGSFNMRRSDSELRVRHVYKPKVTGRTSELNKRQDDPYAP